MRTVVDLPVRFEDVEWLVSGVYDPAEGPMPAEFILETIRAAGSTSDLYFAIANDVLDEISIAALTILEEGEK